MIRRLLITFTTTAVLTTGTACSASAAPHHALRPHTACPTEDSSWCVWDARHRGNGIGRSFWTDHRDRVHYVSHRTAHHMLTR
jgi:hypothetical protein